MSDFRPTRQHFELATRLMTAALDPRSGRTIGVIIEEIAAAGWVPVALALADRSAGLAIATLEAGDPSLTRQQAAEAALAQLRLALVNSRIDGENEAQAS